MSEDCATARWAVPAAAGVLLATVNVVNNRMDGSREERYIASCLLAAGALLGLAGLDGRSWNELGLEPSRVPTGLRMGGAAGLAAATVTVAALGSERARAALDDDRAVRRGRRGAVRAALLRVPLGTVVLEEVAFRSVVPALLERHVGGRRAHVTSALLFGLWHVLPGRKLATDNAMARRAVGGSKTLGAGLAVASTIVAGLGFGELRHRSGSLIAPALLHWSFNSGGYLAAAFSAPLEPGVRR
ncbi:MAG: CPBP family intramembrane metalloprotease [Actinomycetota bacterium]|nr:CPBP family intramembrane metalloprotease [Actinomycetota bacterium]